MNQEKIDRINALYHKSQSVGLSPEEQENAGRSEKRVYRGDSEKSSRNLKQHSD